MNDDRSLVLGTAGHIDHGKTALVRALTGVDTDRLPAEKARGITIDLGFAALFLGDRELSLVDVPGHERFIRNMLAGATGLDLALLVVAADDSVMPQTREHLEILRLLGLNAGLIALTKCDLADSSWLDLVEEDVRTLVRGTFLEGAPVVRTSAATGTGIDSLRAELAALARDAPRRNDPGPFRMAIDRSFTLAGHGTVVTGTIASGGVAVGDELHLMPEARPVRVRGLHAHNRAIDRLDRGARAAVNLAGIHHLEVRRGQELATPGFGAATRILTVECHASPEAPFPIRHRSRCRLHLGTADVAATVVLFAGDAPLGTAPSLAQLSLAEPVSAVHGEPFVLRSESPAATLGGGRIIQPTARRIRRSDRRALGRVDGLRDPNPQTRIAAFLAIRGLTPWTELDACREAGVPLSELDALTSRLAAAGLLVDLPIGPRRTTRVLAHYAEELDDRVERAIGRLHDARPRQTAIRRSHVAAELPDLPGEGLIAGVIERLKSRGTVVADARTVALAGHKPRLSQGERRLKDDIADRLQAEGLTPSDRAAIDAMAGARADAVPELLAILVDEGRIVEINPGFYLDSEAEARMRRAIVERLSGGGSIAMADLRDLLGITRKHAVPYGEYLDRIGVTRREGDLRLLGPAVPQEP